jgi:hypothetical protein
MPRVTHPTRWPAPAAAIAALFAGSAAVAAEGGEAMSLFQRSIHGTAGARLEHAVGQFANWANWLELVAAIALSVGLALLLAYHPRSSRRRDAVEADEDRKTLVMLGVVGAVVAALVVIDQAMALVIFGIGSLIRFRTVVGSPHMTGRAILVVVVGLACGLTQFFTAIVVAGAGWAVIWWLNAHRAVRVKVRLVPGADRQKATLVAADALRRMGCRVQSHKEGSAGKSVSFVTRVPIAVEDETLARSLEAALVGELGRAEVEVRG